MASLKGGFGRLFINDEPITDVEVVQLGKTIEEPKEESKDEEWIWVEGFKGMDKDMKCRDMPYEIGGRYVHTDDVEMCSSGYHFCLNLKDVLDYYKIGDNNRFFRVKGLVRKSNVDQYGKIALERYSGGGVYPIAYDKVVAKEIIIEDELTNEEIFSLVDLSDKVKGEEYFDIARKYDVDHALNAWQCDQLIECGYSKLFVEMLKHMDEAKRNRAIAVGHEPELSMDMKCWIVFKD